MANATSNNPVTRDRDCWRALIWSCSSSFMLTPSGRPLTRRKEGRDKEWNKQKAAVQASSSSRRFPAERKQARKSVASGKSVSVRVDIGGRRVIKKKKKK